MHTSKNTHTHFFVPHFLLTTRVNHQGPPQRPSPQPHPIPHTTLPLNLINYLFQNVPIVGMGTPERPQAYPRRSRHSWGEKKTDTDTYGAQGWARGRGSLARAQRGVPEGSAWCVCGGTYFFTFINSTSRYKALALCLALFQGLGVHLPPSERASQRSVQRSSAWVN